MNFKFLKIQFQDFENPELNVITVIVRWMYDRSLSATSHPTPCVLPDGGLKIVRYEPRFA